MNKENLKKIRFFLCIPATGKSHLAKIDDRFVDIDQEEAIYKYNYDKEIDPYKFATLQHTNFIVNHDSEEYIQNKILKYLKDGKIILSATHSHIFEFLEKTKIPYAIIQYHPSLVEHFRERMKSRGNTDEFIDDMLKNRSKSYVKHKENKNATAVLELKENQFVSDVLLEIFGEKSDIKTNNEK